MSWTLMLKALAVMAANPHLGATADHAVLTDADLAEIRSVVRHQLAAFRAWDPEQALASCAPALAQNLGSGRALLQLVHATYPALAAPAVLSFGAMRLTPDGLGQDVLLVDEDGDEHHALYVLETVDGLWKVKGCVVVPGRVEAGATA